jgi:hypothetical protein
MNRGSGKQIAADEQCSSIFSEVSGRSCTALMILAVPSMLTLALPEYVNQSRSQYRIVAQKWKTLQEA